MQQSLKSLALGVASGALTCAASIYTLGYTNAFAMPRGFPLALWDVVVVFGLGAMLVAFVIHLTALRVLAAKTILAFTGFAVAVLLALAVAGLLALSGKAIAAWLIGALLASAAHGLRRSNNSFKPKPLRGSA